MQPFVTQRDTEVLTRDLMSSCFFGNATLTWRIRFTGRRVSGRPHALRERIRVRDPLAQRATREVYPN